MSPIHPLTLVPPPSTNTVLPALPPLNTLWLSAMDKNNRTYYWNLLTRETAWDTVPRGGVLATPEQIEFIRRASETVGHPGVVQADTRPKSVATGFQFFMEANRETFKAELQSEGAKCSMAFVTKRGGDRWKQLDKTEQDAWNVKCKEDKIRFELEMKAWLQRHPDEAKHEKEFAQTGVNGSTITQISKVREIVRLDLENKKIQASATLALARATDLFVKTLAEEAVARCPDKKRLRLIDVHHVVYADDERFGFLSEDFETPAELSNKEEKEKRTKLAEKVSVKAVKTARPAPVNQPISSYFAFLKKPAVTAVVSPQQETTRTSETQHDDGPETAQV